MKFPDAAINVQHKPKWLLGDTDNEPHTCSALHSMIKQCVDHNQASNTIFLLEERRHTPAVTTNFSPNASRPHPRIQRNTILLLFMRVSSFQAPEQSQTPCCRLKLSACSGLLDIRTGRVKQKLICEKNTTKPQTVVYGPGRVLILPFKFNNSTLR